MQTTPDEPQSPPPDATAPQQAIDLEALAELVFEIVQRELRLESDRTGK